MDSSSNGSCGNSSSIQSVVFAALFPPLYAIIFIGGLVLNSLAAWIFFQIKNRSSFILYLKNIAVADLVMTLTFPFTIASESGLGPWQLKAFVCRYSAVVFYASMYVSLSFLGLISLDRYLKIVKPFGESKLYNFTFTKFVSMGVWLGMIFLSLPNTILTNKTPTSENAHCCTYLKSDLGLKWHAAVSYINICIFIAVLVILIASYISIYKHVHRSNQQFVCTAKRETKPSQNIYIILVVFSICFVPYHLWRIPFTLSQIDKHFGEVGDAVLMYGKRITLFMSACNVCLDPVIYFLMCKSFTRKLGRKLHLGHHSSLNDSRQSTRRTQVRRFREYPSARE
nr:PREDICTED: G-protein coupled receptor 87-like [Lepisosteus oculatus]XP_015216117.1 PREDICTED: G-protein coupled receptor 87-like [Lepisosteus oculatus]XP_015216118.1 PREDICTED: G-protein coupled receptor 87-like [Lepisosteus oculatus]XP_015216119.1 PREDICTED: G-protein coupled receptor 87-like [Lepisosteus oculatus]